MANPFFDNIGGKPPARDLDQFVHEANQNWFVKDSGRPYFVNTKVNGDGTVTRFMDRHG